MSEPKRETSPYRSSGYLILLAAALASALLFLVPAGVDSFEGGSGYGLSGRGAFIAGLLALARPGRTWALYCLIAVLLLLAAENLVVQYPIGAPAWLNVAILSASAGSLLLPQVRKYVANAV